MKLPFVKKKEAALDLSAAEQMLSNVFTACGHAQNSVPLEALVSYSNYRKERYAWQRTLIVLMLVLFMLLPILFFAANIHVRLVSHGGENPAYAVSVSAKVPVRQIQARMDGRSVPIYEISPDQYLIQPGSNGVVDITVTLLNRQRTTSYLSVTSVDSDAPVLVSTEMGEDYICLFLSDDASGVDYEGIAVSDESGNAVAVIGWDADKNCVWLPYPDRPMNVRIPDLRGNALQIALKPAG